MSTEFELSFLVETFDAPADPSALAGVLFADDFDLDMPLPPEATAVAAGTPEALPAAAPIDEAALLDARLEGFAAGQAAARAESASLVATASGVALSALTRALQDTAATAHGIAAGAADTLAGDMLRMLAAALPELCSRHGAAEARALADALLPMLRQQPRIVLRANPHTLPALQDCIARHRGDTPDRISVVGTDALEEGDISLEWQDGSATRDSAGLCRELAAMLKPIGIDTAPATHHGGARAAAAERELAHAG